MSFPYTIAIPCKHLGNAMQIINAHALGDQVVQFIQADNIVRWLVIRCTGDQWQAWKKREGFPPVIDGDT